MTVTLIGFRGSGKSTVGPLLAERLGWAFIDADAEIERRAGRTIRQIFEESGEPEFRRIEREVMADLLQSDRRVIAAGGGAVLDPQTRAALRNSGPVVWLRAEIETLTARIETDPTTRQRRPRLTTSGGKTEVEHLLAERNPIYARCATVAVDTDRLAAEQITEQILRDIAAAIDEGKPQ